MIIHYNCTIGSILLHSFLLICHPYPPSFHEMIFTLVTGAAHTVIPIQRQHAHKIEISVHVHLTYIEGRCVSLQKAQWKRRHDYPDAEVARRDRARRAAQSSQATKNCRGSETAEARERRSTRDRDRRKRRLDSESAEEKDTRLSSEMLSKISLIQTAYRQLSHHSCIILQ